MNLLHTIASALDAHDYPDFQSPVPSEGSMLRAQVVIDALGLREQRATFYGPVRIDDNTRQMERTHYSYVTPWHEIKADA